MTQTTVPAQTTQLRKFARQTDQLLRACFQVTDKDQTVDRSLRSLLIAVILLGAAYGASMGLYSVTMKGFTGTAQLVSTTLKVPLLFLLTLGVTFPSLYVFSAVQRCPLSAQKILKLQLTGLVLCLALLASFGPVTAFFTLSTDSYSFMVLLNVLFFAICGGVGLRYINSQLFSILVAPTTAEVGPRDTSRRLFVVWLVMFMTVGAQMGWVLRPFIGNPEEPFVFFRGRDSNVFEAVFVTFLSLFAS